MDFLLLAFICFGTVSVSAVDQQGATGQSSPIEWNGPITLKPYDTEDNEFDSEYGYGYSADVTECGGTGRVFQWQIGFCNPKFAGPCYVHAAEPAYSKLLFTAGSNSSSLNFKGNFSVVEETGESLQVRGKSINHGPVEAGQQYLVTLGLKHSGNQIYRYKTINATVTITREEDGEEEVCASVIYEVK